MGNEKYHDKHSDINLLIKYIKTHMDYRVFIPYSEVGSVDKAIKRLENAMKKGLIDYGIPDES